MTSFGYRLNPRYAIKECSSCGTLYTKDCSCSKGSVEDKMLVPKPPKNCARCGHPGKGVGFELGRSGEGSGESWVRWRLDGRVGRSCCKFGGKWGW
nr:hypothetical protein [Tanacetum cinerariifolium]